jgi:hypothetical protein
MGRPVSRRTFLGGATLGAAGLLAARAPGVPAESETKHVVTLSFDDGFRESSLKTAEIYERLGLAACINVVATAHLPTFEMPNEYHEHPVGDFAFWNELQARGHEIMPHGLKHANKAEMPLAQARDLILQCLDVFDRELEGFDRTRAVFNFPFNASTPAVEEWLSTQVMAFRTGGPPINPLPHPGQVRLTCTSHGPGGPDLAAATGHRRSLVPQGAVGLPPRCTIATARMPKSDPTTTVKAIQVVSWGTAPIQNHRARGAICGKSGEGGTS